jgi:predicted enzyme related to lactoylglutathione lyase
MTLPRSSLPATTPPLGSESRVIGRAGKSAVRFGVDDLDAQIAELNDAGIATGEPVVIADMVTIVDIADLDGNEISFVADISAE